MQADLGSPVTGESIPVHYAYVARYQYTDVVVRNDNFLRLSAFTDRYQTAGACYIGSSPIGSMIGYLDRLGNQIHRIRITEPHEQLILTAVGEVHLSTDAPTVADIPLTSVTYGLEADEYLTPSPLVNPSSVLTAATIAGNHADTLLDTVRNVNEWVYQQVRYQRGATSVFTTAADVLESLVGVCQDKTHLALGMMRALGIPARYVSGLLTRQPGETHAWLEFLHPDCGWLAADPTRGVVIDTGTDYLKFAVGRDYSEVPPVTGSFVSRGDGHLDFATSEVYFDRESISLVDAFNLMGSTLL
jgi:transglutaminase-like putative cysteine protease